MAKNTIKILKGAIGRFPLTLELVQTKLAVTVHHHHLLGTGSHIPCWTYVSHGLSKLKQKELVFTLKLNDIDTAPTFSRSPLKIFLLLYHHALKGQRVDIGDITSLGENGLFGFSGIGYTVGLLKANELPLPASYLSCVLLSKEEHFVAQALGLSRVIARLGYEKNRFPLLPWNDRQHRGVAFQNVLKTSMVRNLKPLRLKHCTVNLIAGDKVVLVLSPLLQRALVDYFNAKNATSPVCLLTQFEVYHEGCLVWLPGRDSIEMNTLPGASGELIAGSFIILAPGKEQTGATMLEDGFLMEFTSEAWTVFKNAIAKRVDESISASHGGMDFSISWQTGDAVDQFGFIGRGVEHDANPDSDDASNDDGFISRIARIFKR